MDFSSVKAITIPEGAVTKIVVNDMVLWQAATYKNWAHHAIDTDGSIYNGGLGYIDGYRLSSSGGISASQYTTTTGFIPVKAGDVIRVKGYRWYTDMTSTQYLIAYSSSNSFAKVYTATSQSRYQTTSFVESMEYVDGISIIKLKAGVSGYDYFRLCTNDMNEEGGGYNSNATGAKLIVTVNEEIT